MSHKEHKHGHHDHHNPSNNNNTTILLSIIIVLLVIIAIGAFYLGQTMSKQTQTPVNNNANTSVENQVA
jgi:flagellar basal body-associated protein FliL